MLTPKLWRTPRRSRCSAALRRKRSASTRRSASFARIQREGASAPPAPTPRKYKNKNLAGDGGVGPAFAPECRVVRDRTEKPQDEHEAMRPAPVYPKCVYGHSATGPRVMNPAFHFVSNRVYSAPRTSPARAFFARLSMYVGCARLRDNSRARLPLLCTYRLHVCPHVGYVRTVRIRVGLSHSRLAERYTGENKQGSLQKREKIVRQEKINAVNKMVTCCQLTKRKFLCAGIPVRLRS